MEGVEFDSQSGNEAVVVIDHAKEALKAGLGGGNGDVITAWTLDLRSMMSDW